jgi:soluble lytic murein transglycosylase-like protein
MVEKPALIALARQKAEKYGLDGDLVCALCEQESDWDPFAVRYEPGFLSRYVAPLYSAGKISSTEAYTRSISWGLLQLMGQVAREKGFDGPYLSALCDPESGLEWGCKYFSALMGRSGNDIDAALNRWNGGGNAAYVQEVKNRIDTYNV